MRKKATNIRSNHINITLKMYSQFKNEIEQLRTFSMEKGTLEFEQIVKSAYTKCYDFIIYCCKTKEVESAFFRLPALRSICEDLITINYLLNLTVEEREKIMLSLSSQEIYESIIVQEDFFQKNNPAQILVSSELIPKEEKEKILNRYTKGKKQNLEYVTLPSVFKMAKTHGLEDLYKYIYNASSKAVHFSIDTLLKMGWGDLDKQTEVITGKSSYKNYYLYYQDFTIFYASYIFIKQTNSFRTIIPISNKLINEASKLMSEYNKIDWPEVTTFDHLNIKGPSQIIRLLTRSTYNLSNEFGA